MSCRETAAGSMITSWAHIEEGQSLTDQAVLSTFHQLRRSYLEADPATRNTYDDDRYYSLLDRQADRIRNAHARGQITQARRESLLARVERARGDAVPPQDMLYAMHNLVPAVRNRAGALTAVVANIAERTGLTQAEVRTQFERDRRGRTTRNTTLSPATTSQAIDLGLPRDAGSVYAWSMLEAQARASDIQRARLLPQRITRNPVNAVVDTNTTIVEWGYDSSDGRLEVVTRDAAGEDTVRAYRDVPADVGTNTTNLSLAWSRNVRGNPRYQYGDEHEAVTAGVAARCDTCGQYRSAGHACPVRPVRLERWGSRLTTQTVPFVYVDEDGDTLEREVGLQLPAIRRMQEAARSAGGGALDLDGMYMYDVGMGHGQIRGDITFRREDDGTYTVDISSARCTCQDYHDTGHCPHLDLYARAIRYRLARPSAADIEAERIGLREAAVTAAAERVRLAAEAVRARNWTADPAQVSQVQPLWRSDAEVTYSDNPAAFETDVAAAVVARAAKNDEPDIPYMLDNAFDGLATRASGQGFGFEIEFRMDSNLSYEERARRLRELAQDLYDEGITSSSYMDSYHSSARQGYSDVHATDDGTGTWRLEADGSVDGELVTPIMYDEPETWRKVAKVCEIMKRHGAVAHQDAGMHINVGTRSLAGDARAYTNLASFVSLHEDAMVRMASDPRRGTHRNNGYSAAPADVPVQGFRDMREVHSWQRQTGRQSLVNYGHAAGNSSDRVEFRVFDSTLDPGAMQAQARLAVGLVHAAETTAGRPVSTQRERWGDHQRRASSAVDGPDALQDSGTVRSLIDLVARRREDKAQLAAVFANTRWSQPPPR